jgi:hypothetical protein
MLTFWGVPLFHTKPLFYALLYAVTDPRAIKCGDDSAPLHLPAALPVEVGGRAAQGIGGKASRGNSVSRREELVVGRALSPLSSPNGN